MDGHVDVLLDAAVDRRTRWSGGYFELSYRSPKSNPSASSSATVGRMSRMSIWRPYFALMLGLHAEPVGRPLGPAVGLLVEPMIGPDRRLERDPAVAEVALHERLVLVRRPADLARQGREALGLLAVGQVREPHTASPTAMTRLPPPCDPFEVPARAWPPTPLYTVPPRVQITLKHLSTTVQIPSDHSTGFGDRPRPPTRRSRRRGIMAIPFAQESP